MIQFNVLAMQQDGKFENLLLTDDLEKAAKTVEKYVKEATGESFDWLASAGQVTPNIFVGPKNHTVVLSQNGIKTTITVEKHDLAAEEQESRDLAEAKELFSLWQVGKLSPYEAQKRASSPKVYNLFDDWAMRESKKWGRE
ncbi:hypothetical protein [Limosilactobacillus ingluviei]|uniref:hypothetical protein n=1 Tax=Limosilactobacillus ingluviei TaxID=148604 RepID=UPI0023F4EB2B|nr:hypothetical protein [Limosilactobacillus ingluviei]